MIKNSSDLIKHVNDSYTFNTFIHTYARQKIKRESRLKRRKKKLKDFHMFEIKQTSRMIKIEFKHFSQQLNQKSSDECMLMRIRLRLCNLAQLMLEDSAISARELCD